MAQMNPKLKVSCHIATAKNTARHNDRSMYKYGYERRNENDHYDVMGMGNSHRSEIAWYEENFAEILKEQNQRALDMRKPERVMSLEQYRLKHMPQELILQIGNHEDYEAGRVDDSYCRGAVKKVIAQIEDMGGIVLSWDLHNDETEDPENLVDDVSEDEEARAARETKGSPHLHLRFVMLDANKRVNVNGCLKEHGVERPNLNEEETQKNNRKITFTSRIREAAETYGHEWCKERGFTLDDQNRSKRPHQPVNEFKRAQLVKDVVNLENKQEALEQEQQETIEELNSLHTQKSKAKQEVQTIEAKRDDLKYETEELEVDKLNAQLELKTVTAKRDEKQEELDGLSDDVAIISEAVSMFKSFAGELDEVQESLDNQSRFMDTAIESAEEARRLTEERDEQGKQIFNYMRENPPSSESDFERLIDRVFDVCEAIDKRNPELRMTQELRSLFETRGVEPYGQYEDDEIAPPGALADDPDLAKFMEPWQVRVVTWRDEKLGRQTKQQRKQMTREDAEMMQAKSHKQAAKVAYDKKPIQDASLKIKSVSNSMQEAQRRLSQQAFRQQKRLERERVNDVQAVFGDGKTTDDRSL